MNMNLNMNWGLVFDVAAGVFIGGAALGIVWFIILVAIAANAPPQLRNYR